MGDDTNSRIESEQEVIAYIQNLKYALNSGARLVFQVNRRVDKEREERYTNQYTVEKLFPSEDPVSALKRELFMLSPEEYIRTVRDIRFTGRSEMREFGKVYEGKGDVYIKIRVELLNVIGETTTFVMSFHFAEKAFTPDMFPYRKG